MPEEGLPWLQSQTVLSDDEMIRLIRIAIEMLSVEKVRFTGGEPLLRHGLTDIISAVSQFRTPAGIRPTLGITTNAVSLSRFANDLAKAGIDRVNISLDTLDPGRYLMITKRDRFHDVLDGIAAARNAGIHPIKINAVPQPRWFADDAARLLEFCLIHGYQLRFIEQMPLGPEDSWDRKSLITQDDLIAALTDAGFELTPSTKRRGSAPAALWNVRLARHLRTLSDSDVPTTIKARPGDAGAVGDVRDDMDHRDGHSEGTAGMSADQTGDPTAGQTGDLTGLVGIIASVTQPFCSECSRTRLTSDGQIRSCLFSSEETDLRSLIRADASDDQIAAKWQEAMWTKPRAHGIDDGDFARASRTMSAIGG